MIRLNIDSQKHGQRYLDFNSQQELDLYMATIGTHWGVPASQQVIPEVSDPETGEILQEAQIIDIPGTVTYTVQDITEQVQAENLLKEGLKRQELGAKIVARVWAINESKQISAEQFQALITDQNLERIERLLWTGSLRTAKSLILSLDNTYFTEQEKQQILDMLQEY